VKIAERCECVKKISIVRNAVVQVVRFQQLSSATDLTGSKGISHYETKRAVCRIIVVLAHSL